MRRATPTLINRLLSRREGPSPLEHEEMLKAILEQPGESARGWRLKWAWGFAVAASLALLVVIRSTGPVEGAFTARGASGPSVELACLRDGVASSCAVGDRLLFKVADETSEFASAVGLLDGAANWYFVSTKVSAGQAPTVLGEAVVIDAAHGPGTFDVVMVFSSTPLDRDEVKRVIEQGGNRVVHRTLVVQP